MTAYIAIGSNLNNRKENILKALELMAKYDLPVQEVSPIYETPAIMLFQNVQNDWNKPFYNCVVKLETSKTAFDVLTILKDIEIEMGRVDYERWSPRVIDLDIIEFNNEQINTSELVIPHKNYLERSFVLDPLSFFKEVPAENLYSKTHQPLIMGILNVTPDSFSDGGKFESFSDFENEFQKMSDNNIHIIDVGGQSTRHNAIEISATEELNRLKDVFNFTKNRKKTLLSSRLSIDTFNFEVAEKALESGFDIINDVKGFSDEKMLDLLCEHKDKKAVFMHNEDIETARIEDTLSVIQVWLEKRIEAFLKKGLKLENIIFDCGIGFGKTASQSLSLLQDIDAFHQYGVKIMVGHSRKSLMDVFTNKSPQEKDIETLAMSLKLAEKVDILRVHTPIEHKQALIAAGHLNIQFV